MKPIFAAITIFIAFSSGATAQTPEPECPPPPYDGPTIFIVDYHDCHWYYECVEGDKKHFECPPDQYFDMFEFFCGDLSNVTCSTSTSPEPTPPTKPTARPTSPTPPTRPSTPPTPPTEPSTPPTPPTKPSTPPTPPTSPTKPPTPPTPPTTPTPEPECPPPDYTGPTVYIVDYHDCHWYYECEHGDKVHVECPPDQYFDMFEFFCGDLSNVTCSTSTSSTPTDRPTSPTPPTRPSTPPTPPTPPTKPPTSPTPTTKPTPAPGQRCIGVTDGEYIPYPEDCSRYIECVGEKEYYFHCPRDVYYDKSTRKCSSSSDDRC